MGLNVNECERRTEHDVIVLAGMIYFSLEDRRASVKRTARVMWAGGRAATPMNLSKMRTCLMYKLFLYLHLMDEKREHIESLCSKTKRNIECKSH